MKSLNFFKISKSQMSNVDFNVSTFRNGGKSIILHLLRQVYLIGGRPTRLRAWTIKQFLIKLNHLKRDNGLPGVVKYLKVCTVVLQQVIAGHALSDCGLLGMRISRTHSGIPRIIPPRYRGLIKGGHAWSIRFWLTLFSLYRNISYKGPLKLKTITDPSKGQLLNFLPSLDPFIRLFCLGDLILKPSRPFPILTASPNTRGKDEYSTQFKVLIRSLFVMKYHYPDVLGSLLYIIDFTKSSSLRTLYSRVNSKIESLMRRSEVLSTSVFQDPELTLNRFIGKLAIKDEPAGKVRVFAMVDCWTQWTLKSLHDLIFSILSKHQMDGTFDQLKPLKWVPFGKCPIDSLDLSAATDRLPIWLQQLLLSRIFGKAFAYHWSNLLVGRTYSITSLLARLLINKNYIKTCNPTMKILLEKGVKYTVGQPMGALSSWAMLALTHHFIVQHCAWEVGYSRSSLFQDYAILGDDIVIWDLKVSQKYQSIMALLGVELGIAKSVISPSGLGLEFAKRTIFKGEDVSPAPLKEAQAAHRNMSGALEIMRKYSLSPNSLIKFLGYGPSVVITKNNLKMKILRMILALPSNALQMSNLLIFQQMLWGKEDYLALRIQRRHMVKVIMNYLIDLKRRIDLDQSTLHQWILEKSLNSSPMWNMMTDIFKDNPLSPAFATGVVYSVYEDQAHKKLKDLISFKQRVQSYIYMLTYLHTTISSPNYLIPPLMDDKLWNNHRDVFMKIVSSMIQLEHEYDSVSIQLILKPKRAEVVSKVLPFENKSTLRFWNYWIKVLSKTNFDNI